MAWLLTASAEEKTTHSVRCNMYQLSTGPAEDSSAMKLSPADNRALTAPRLDTAIQSGIDYGGWCPKGGLGRGFPKHPDCWRISKAEGDATADPAQRTEWNVRDANACLIVVDGGLNDITGTVALAQDLAHRYRKPVFVADLANPDPQARGALAARPAGKTRRCACACRRRPARERSAGDLRPRGDVHRRADRMSAGNGV